MHTGFDDDEITWEGISNSLPPSDYEKGFFVHSRSRLNGVGCTEVEIYHLRGFQVLQAEGVYFKKWEDGRLLRCKVFDLNELMCSTQYEFSRAGKRQCLSAVWFPKKQYGSMSRGTGLRLRVPFDQPGEWLRFESFIKAIGDRIVTGENNRV